MTVVELVTEISKRLGDPDSLMYASAFIKDYLFKAMSVVFVSDAISESDYFGLSAFKEITDDFIAIDEPIKKIQSVKGDTGTVRYIYKDPSQIDALVGQPHLEPQTGERFYFIRGNTIRLYGGAGGDTSVTVYYIPYPAKSYTDSTELSTLFSPSFIELSVRETIKQITIELDVRT